MFSVIISSLIIILYELFLIMFLGYVHLVEPNRLILFLEIIMVVFGLIYFIYLIPKIMRKVE